MARPPGWVLGAAVAASVAAASTAALFIRLADAPPLAVAFWRLFLATVVLAPAALALRHRELRALSARDLSLLALVGVVLAVHFATWIASLSYTSVASSLVLVTMHPVFVGTAAHFLWGERVPAGGWAGILVALSGVVVIAGGDFGRGALLGDALALAGAVAMTLYLLAGRRFRRRVSLLSNAFVVYSTSAVALGAAALLMGVPLAGYAGEQYVLFALLALVPMLLGHSVFNWTLAWLPAVVVSTAILGEPVGSTLLAFFVLGEVPPSTSLVGGLVVLLGIGLFVWANRRT
ncbi:MAG: DMT family transporter [Methanobacteriota archaeon]